MEGVAHYEFNIYDFDWRTVLITLNLLESIQQMAVPINNNRTLSAKMEELNIGI